ncbi:ketosteroid isomerase-related protein [Paeniroseomonas aquatica]|uniref:Ketosteroid isomerase-related protein n=1 Tax=Paeniroseomonas aquatica TaxID=373043 RepID=A0ABT8A909_9PROT|nr:ketosteroid isomerase-related protein [Paeniroseomonas aquatica]MDN3565906.1 ketosteroid isomerase-related protein [Paeniroseomonas aquatica]
MTETETESLIRTYYAAFGHGDREAMLALLAEDVVHDVNQGPRERGKAAFRDFLGHMDHSYRERLTGLTIMVDASGSRAAAEFVVEGEYLATDAGLPPARGQRYSLAAGAFFAVAEGRITRVTTYYNLQEWLRQIGGAA